MKVALINFNKAGSQGIKCETDSSKTPHEVIAMR
jgi:hypothetical protein